MAFSTHRSILHRFCAPSLLLLCSFVCLPTHAQGSGGGWVSYQVPNPPPYVPGAATDWTGLTVSRDIVRYDGTPDSYTGTSYISYFTIGDNVGANTNQSIMYSVTGPSTYKWNWTPTGSNVSAPAPSLYVLAQASGAACLRPNNDGHTVGLTGSATFNFSSSVSAFTYGPLDIVTQYKVMPAPGSTPAVVGVNPTLTANVSGSPAGDEGYSSLFVSTAASPLVIAAPDPMGRPDLGDGTNQFVYGAQQPDGFLYIPGAIQAVGASHDATEWLIGGDPVVGSGDKVDLKIETSAISGTFTHQWAVSNDILYVNTPQNTDNPYPQYQFNHWIFKGLPSNNSSFGNHDVNLYVQGTKSQTAKIQTFFSGTASNYPYAADDNANRGYYIPNWYNYYELAFPNSTVYNPTMTLPNGQSYPDAVGLAYVEGYDYNGGVVITNGYTMMCGKVLTNKSAQVIPVFEISPATNFLDVTGTLNVRGIYSYLYVDGHEATHIAEYRSGDVIPRNSDNTLPPGVVDSDGDFIPDNIEGKYHLDPHNSDTTGYFTDASSFPEGSYDNRGDEEAIAAIGGLHAVVSNSSAWQQDWSDQGVQYGTRPANFPFEFVPANTNLPSTNAVPSYAVTNLP